MKLYKSIFAVAAAGMSLGFTGCDNDFDRPPVIVPEATYEVNTAISEFKEMFWDIAQSNSSTTIPVNANGDSIILGGRIISSDKDGNVYQHIYFRDESGALDIRVHGYDLYESYPMGQEVRINVTGLLVGGYGKQMQIGTLYNGSVGGIEPEDFSIRAQRNGLPSLSDAEPYTVTISDLNSWINDKSKLIAWQCQLVKIENVSFVDGGKAAWCDNPGATGATNRTLKDADGNTIDVRTSNKCTFSSQILPKGTGTVVALLGYYASSKASWQLTFMDPESGCIDGFEFVDTPETPDEPTPGTTIYSALGEDASTIDWSYESNSVEGVEAVWTWKEYSGKHYLNASAYSGGKAIASKAYAYSPVIDLSKAKSASLTFEHAAKFQTTLRTLCCAVVREEGAASWTELAIPSWPEAGAWTFANSGSIDLSAYAGKKIHVGFKYGSDESGADTWEIRNLKISE
ncbi:DUF5689 domain-containing protein [uncultured Duncaniella sp.]|uniref:DUF5689 domain-containing protein n=1 Tax=uncultured Duncaniella sp. TaxID=2768039 RepID=UPI0025A9AFCB|nr:DUF5689 domain-containing protein [uncultured Duncaniella sp.]